MFSKTRSWELPQQFGDSSPQLVRDRLPRARGSGSAVQAAKDKVTMQEVIDRLKSETEMEARQAAEEGAAAGAEWAKRYAKPAQLKRLAKAAESYEFGFVEDEMNANYPPALQFAYCVSSAKDREDSFILKEIAHETFGDDWAQLDAEYADAFAHAAIEVWESVEPLL